MLKLSDAGYRVAEREILAPISLAVRPGSMVGLIGHNGSGKSTALGLMAGQIAPTTGRVLLCGRDVRAWPAKARARRISHLPQTPPPAPGITVGELAALGRYASHGALGRFGPVDRAAVDDALDATGLAELRDRFVDSLSGGERQRAWIAMLVAQQAECLLLDEPTAALDLAHQIDVLRLVRGLAADRGLAVVAVLHDVNLAARFCDELVALRGGRLIERGTPTEILSADVLERIYGLPMRVIPHPDGAGSIGFPA